MSLINEAFKELKGIDLDEELFSFDEKGARDLSYFLDDTSDPVLDIVDPLATDEEELQPSYEGNIICQCCVCKQLIYKKPEDVIIDEETQNANVGEECPHCYNTRGFKVIGQVEPYFDKDEVKVTVDDDEVEVEDDGIEEVAESLNEAWEDAYRQFTEIVDNNIGDPDQIEKRVDALYAKHKGEEDWDFAYRRWMEGSDELTEGTVKTKKGWVNKGKAGTHGTFKTKKAADAQRKAMFAQGYKGESLKEDFEEDAKAFAKSLRGARVKFLGFNYKDAGIDAEDIGWYKSLEGEVGTITDYEILDGYVEGNFEDSFERMYWDVDFDNGESATGISGLHLKLINRKRFGESKKLREDLDPALVAKMNKESFINYVTVRKGWTEEEAEDYLKTYFNEALDEKLTIEVTEEDINHFDEDTGDVIVDKAKFVGKDVQKGDYVTLRFTDENEDADTQDYKFVEETEDGFKLEWIGTKELHEDLTTSITLEDIVNQPYSSSADKDRGEILINSRRYVKVGENKWLHIPESERAFGGTYSDKQIFDKIRDSKEVKLSKLEEDFQKATVETGNSILSMESDDSGKVTVTSEPRKAEEGGDETIAPLSDEVVAEIEENNSEDTEEVEAETEETVEETTEEDTATEEETPEEGEEEEATEEEISVGEFEESYFNDLGKKYLQEVYNNVTSYETTKGSIDGNKIKLEGIISFKSGKKAKTEFYFEGHSVTKAGKIKFLGENAQITSKKNAFTLTGSVNKGKLLAESLTYNYRAKDAATGKTVREYGTIKR